MTDNERDLLLQVATIQLAMLRGDYDPRDKRYHIHNLESLLEPSIQLDWATSRCEGCAHFERLEDEDEMGKCDLDNDVYNGSTHCCQMWRRGG